MKLILIPFLVLFSISIYSQEYEEYTIENFYKKIELDNGTLDEYGKPIYFIFIKTNIEEGNYEIEITDGPGDLYEIKGTDLFIKFRGYYGYAGYGEEGILKVNSGYISSAFYKIE